ncbi:MAG: pepA, partial [Alphaproteobacteria bacterium]|nr:pepA [Alphaproteobacteria bacterium]
MQISFTAPSVVTAGAWVVGAAGTALLPAAVAADKASGGALSRAVKFSTFKGKSGQMLEVLAPAGMKASRLLLVGLGAPEALDEKGLETLGAQIVGRLFTSGETVAAVEIDVPKSSKVKKAEAAAHLAFGATLKSYSFNKYRTQGLD